LQKELLQLTQHNTSLLMEIATLNNQELVMEKELINGKKHMTVADTGPLVKKEVEERNRLMALVELQAKELDILKAEINLLRRKGAAVPAILGASRGFVGT